MSTYQPSLATLDHTSDVGMRAWITEFLNALTNGAWSLGGTAFAGWQQTADTGQLTAAALATAVRPAANTALGYVIMTCTDTQGDACKFYVKIEVGTGSAATNPSIWFTIGTQTDGAGAIGGNALLARTQYNAAPRDTSTTRPTYATSGDGYFAIVFKYQGWTTSPNSLFFWWSRGFDDDTGEATSDGITFGISIANSQVLCRNVTSNGEGVPSLIGTNDQATYCLIPGAITSSLVTGVAQAFKWYGASPRVQVLKPFCSVLQAEINSQLTFPATFCGDGEHTYLSIQLGGNQNPNYNNIAGYNVGLLWE